MSIQREEGVISPLFLSFLLIRSAETSYVSIRTHIPVQDGYDIGTTWFCYEELENVFVYKTLALYRCIDRNHIIESLQRVNSLSSTFMLYYAED